MIYHVNNINIYHLVVRYIAKCTYYLVKFYEKIIIYSVYIHLDLVS